MKYAKEIIKEIENRGTIDTDDYLIDDGWEDYIRGKGSMTREEAIKYYKVQLKSQTLKMDI